MVNLITYPDLLYCQICRIKRFKDRMVVVIQYWATKFCYKDIANFDTNNISRTSEPLSLALATMFK